MEGRPFDMNTYAGYQLYQVQRAKTRAEILASDARRGRQAAAVFRGSRALAGQARTPGIMALNAIRAIAAQVTARPA
jgi:hypothetical protein